MRSREIEKRLRKDGWYEDRTEGGHKIFKHPDKEGIVPVPQHPGDIAKGTERAIWREAGLLPPGQRPKRDDAKPDNDQQTDGETTEEN